MDNNLPLQGAIDKKKAEEVLRQIELIVENSNDAIIGETLDGTITSWNGGATRMFGYSTPEAVGKSASFLFPPELKDDLSQMLNKVGAGEVIADQDTIRLHKNGSQIDVAVSISPVKMEDGKIIGASVVERDITQRKKQENRILELNDVRSKFIDIISHQLRTPISAVNWNLESILNGDFGKLEETQYKFLQATHDASQKISSRIGDLLTAMDIEEDRLTFEKREMEINNLAGAVINEMMERCKLKNVLCEYTAPQQELPVIQGDSEKIRTVISKLTENALMYTKPDGKITTKLSLAGNLIRFEVSDTGIGIPTPEQHRVFSRFFRASNASTMQPDAFGLGLFISKSLIEQHGGKIGFSSNEGTGSTFWFEIPVKR